MLFKDWLKKVEKANYRLLERTTGLRRKGNVETEFWIMTIQENFGGYHFVGLVEIEFAPCMEEKCTLSYSSNVPQRFKELAL